MAASESDRSPPSRSRLSRSLPAPIADRPVVSAVVGVTLLALLARLVFLGARPAHWDEARVAYWALYAQEQGSFTYRYIIHGPFVQHASRWLFPLFGVNDFTIRLPVAIVGGLLPLSALLFREHLERGETVVLALFLAFNPVLLYYSRFMRSDVLVGGFMFVALGLFVRFVDTRRARYLYGVGTFVTLAVASKENAVLYLVTWLGAVGLLLDRELDSPGDDVTGVQRVFVGWRRLKAVDFGGIARRYLPHAVGVGLLMGGLFVFMFAPRGAGLEGMYYPPTAPSGGETGFWAALTSPGQWPGLVGTTVDRFVDQYGAWGSRSTSVTFDEYLRRLGGTFKAIGYAATVLGVFSVLGFARERYGVTEGRRLVMLLFFAGVASAVGYPLGLSITDGFKWNVVHALLPLAIPAAVGVAMIGRWAYEGFKRDDPVDVGLSVLIVVVVVGVVAFQALSFVYLNPSQDSIIVQHGQPNDDLSPMIEQFEAVSDGQGLDVLFYANTSKYAPLVRTEAAQSESARGWNFKPICVKWDVALPLNWYLESTDVNTSCATTVPQFQDRVEREQPPIVIVGATDDSVPREWLEERYVASTYNLRSKPEAVPRATVYVRPSLANATA